ncbi:MAG TPA: DNA-processing protein DprA [Thermoanaerobaculia bacterium]|jgi:DNA processing protein|nr:DNA-processing protein DprA [Thermoanaerobaculia bacterium]
MEDRSSARDLLIALTATAALSRAAVCRLAAELDRWAGPGSGGDTRPFDPAERAAELGVPPTQLARALAVLPQAASLARRERERAERLGAHLLTLLDPGYPEGLRQLSLAPPVLYIRGSLPAGPAVAIVGSRRADGYGREVADLFARALAAAGVAVVSGFARGVDAAAHRGALAAGGATVAVLGCGLGVDYPAGHAALGEEIAASGAMVSEFPCGLPPRHWHFPVRNRIIAALTAGTLVVQATPRSGSLITARHALDLGREVWAVPGRIFDERSLGPNALIRDGACLVEHPRDLLETLGRPAPRGTATTLETPEVLLEPERETPPGPAGAILAALPSGASLLPEDLAARAGLAVDQVLGTLLELELNGWVRRHPGGAYGRLG